MRGKVYARDPHTAPSWWTPREEEDKVVVHSMDQVASVNNSVILGNYARKFYFGEAGMFLKFN